MISDIRNAIVYKLKELYPEFKVYIDDVPQKFKKPSFTIFNVDQDYSKRLNTKYRGRITFDVSYFSDKPMEDIKSYCFEKQGVLLKGFDYITSYLIINKGKPDEHLIPNETYRVVNKNCRTTDNVLHMTFDVNYSEMIVEDKVLMQTQETSKINIKKG